MKIKILFLLVLTGCSKLNAQPVTAFDSVVRNIIGFSPVDIYPLDVQDSFITKYQLRVDTNIQNLKKDYYYFRGYTKSHSPFSISFDSLEVQVIHGTGFDEKYNGYYIFLIGHLPYGTEHTEKVKKEVARLITEIEEKIILNNQSVSKKKANLQYEAFYFRTAYNNQFPYLGIGWASNMRKKTHYINDLCRLHNQVDYCHL